MKIVPAAMVEMGCGDRKDSVEEYFSGDENELKVKGSWSLVICEEEVIVCCTKEDRAEGGKVVIHVEEKRIVLGGEKDEDGRNIHFLGEKLFFVPFSPFSFFFFSSLVEFSRMERFISRRVFLCAFVDGTFHTEGTGEDCAEEERD